MSNDKMTPQPTERHREAFAEIKSAREEDASNFRTLKEADERSVGILAEHFPDPQPTTERPTEPGWYWLKTPAMRDPIPVRVFPYNRGVLHVEDIARIYSPVSEMAPACKWLRIDPPASKAKSMAEVEFSEIAAAWHGEEPPASRDVKGESKCTCPTECDCEDEDRGLCSNECPIHNDHPRTSATCPVHRMKGCDR